jgi:equilibrative nucleoside transporter 1/2/3
MFLAAAPYFQIRFQSDPWIYANSQSAILTTFTVMNLVSMLLLTNMQSSANYPFRIITALLINGGVFALLTLSTTTFLDTSPGVYLAFILLMVAISACGTGLMQNGAFSFAASFGRPEYTQAIMAGQGVAGILPPLTQMLTFLAFSDSSPGIPEPPPDNGQSPANNEGATAAFIYFLTAVLISAATLLSFIPLVRRHTRLHSRRLPPSSPSAEEPPTAAAATHHHVPLTTLLAKLRWLAASVAMCFVATMFFPVFTTKILSVHDPSTAGRLFLPGAFIPLGFFFWNLGDLLGRVSTMADALSLRRRPRVLFAVSLARWGFLPLYLACNLHGRGAVIGGDGFYLVGVQGLFGLTNGWLGSSAMMAAGEWVEEGERAAAGGLMSMCLVGGLAAGSVLSFSVAGV